MWLEVQTGYVYLQLPRCSAYDTVLKVTRLQCLHIMSQQLLSARDGGQSRKKHNSSSS